MFMAVFKCLWALLIELMNCNKGRKMASLFLKLLTILLLFICVLLSILKKEKTIFVFIQKKVFSPKIPKIKNITFIPKLEKYQHACGKGWTQDKFLHLSVRIMTEIVFN